MTDREFGTVVQLARESLLGRLASGAAEAWRAAWDDSRLVAVAQSRWSSLASLSAEAHLRLAALTVMWAALGNAVSALVLPRYVVSGLPLMWVGCLAGVSLVVAAFPRAFVLAWQDKLRAAQKSAP